LRVRVCATSVPTMVASASGTANVRVWPALTVPTWKASRLLGLASSVMRKTSSAKTVGPGGPVGPVT
jgi:hypothetical protein